MPESLLINLHTSGLATLLKKSLWHICFPVNFRKFLRTPFLYTCSGCFYQLSDLVFHEYRLKASKQELKCFELFQLEEKITNFVQTMKMYCRGKSAKGTTCKILTFIFSFFFLASFLTNLVSQYHILKTDSK